LCVFNHAQQRRFQQQLPQQLWTFTFTGTRTRIMH
jgi:hypothetical protein